jgi:hypothetical protein
MKKLFIIAAIALAFTYSNNASAQSTLADLGIPFIPVPVIENPDLAMPDMETEVEEPKKETSMNEAAIVEDKDRQVAKKEDNN